jgi:hypothetical protein
MCCDGQVVDAFDPKLLINLKAYLLYKARGRQNSTHEEETQDYADAKEGVESKGPTMI